MTQEELLKEILREQRRSREATPGAQLDPTILNDKFKSVAKESVDLAATFAKGGLEVFGTFQRLSSTGASFSGDLVGMTKAAYNSRMTLGEFSDVIKDNAAKLSGLGGNVTRGAEAFAKLSKEFFDSGAANELRNIGYTSKELNEILAVQTASQKSSYKDTEEGRRKSIQSARELAEQMDAMAKLTGKSREEQLEEMKRRKVDGQVEAKFRLIAMEKGEDVARQVRAEYEKQRIDAQKRGDEELFKQQFATGTYMTKNAGTMAAVMGDQARAMEESAARLAKGDIAGAREASAKADAAALKNASDRTILTLATMGDAAGPAAAAAKGMVETTDTMYHNVKKVAEANGILLKTQQDYAAALKLTMEDIRQAGLGRRREVGADGRPTGPYQDVGGTSRFGAAAQAGAQDVRSAAATVAAEASAKKLNELGQTADKYYQTGLARELEARGRQGLQGTQSNTTVGPDGQPREGGPVSPSQVRRESGGTVGAIGSAIQSLTNLTVDAVTGVANIFLDGKKIPGRSEGSAGTVGKIIEDFGAGTMAILHGKEGVVTEDQLKNLAMGMKTEGIADAISTLKSSVPQTANASIDVNKISQDIKTTFSSITSGETTTTRIQSDDSKSAETELAANRQAYVEERSALAAKFRELMPDASFSERRRAMNASDEAKAIEEKFAEQQKILQKRIEDGIKWEVDRKTEQVNETKQLVDEQVAITKIGADTIINTVKEQQSNLNNVFETDDSFPDIGKQAIGMTPMSSGLPSIDLNALNLPGFNTPKIKAAASQVPTAVKDAETMAREKEAKAKEERDRSGITGEKTKAPETKQSTKEATLNDVVATLNALNIKMGQLLAQNEDLGNKQVKATRNVAASANLYKG